jgi:lauroyl/myristoyl acyltransferase
MPETPPPATARAGDLLAGLPWLRWTLWSWGARLCPHIPIRALRFAALAAGWLAWIHLPAMRRRAERRLAALVPAAAAPRTARRAFAHFAVHTAELLRLDRLPAEPVQVVDPWRIFATRPLAGPAILVTAHANWERLAEVLHRLGLTAQLETVAAVHPDRRIDALLAGRRQRVGLRSATLDRAPLPLLRALRDRRVVILAADRPGQRTLTLYRRGHPLPAPMGPAALAVQADCPLIPVLLGRKGLSGWFLLVGRPLHPDPRREPPERTRHLAEGSARILHRLLAACPGQWAPWWPETPKAGPAQDAAVRHPEDGH